MAHYPFRPILMGLALSALLPLSAAAYDGVATVAADSVQLLDRPAAQDAQILTQALRSDVVLVVEEAETEGWYKVDYCTIQGYVPAAALDITGQYDAPLCYGKVVTDGSALNVRVAPSSDSAKTDSVNRGSILALQGYRDGWFQVETDGQIGFVSADYILATNWDGKRNDDPPQPDSAELEAQILEYAKQFLGVPYVYGGSTPKGFDCSGFTSYVYKHFGYSLNRSAAGQLSNGRAVSREEMRPGDLILWKRSSSSKAATHVGIYVGDGMYIHAPQTGEVVKIAQVTSTAKRTIVGIRRII